MRFTTTQRIRIVQLCAERRTPTEVIARLRLEFPELADVPMGRSSIVHYYYPRFKSGRGLSQPLRAIFYATREHHDKAVLQEEPGSKQWRIRTLIDLVYKNQANPKLCAELLEQVAKEMGGIYTKKAETASADRAQDVFAIMELPIEEKAARIRAILEEGERLADLAENARSTDR